MAIKRGCGWVPPTPSQQVRALLRSHPEARASVLAKVVPDPTSDLSQYTCPLDQGALGSCQSNGPAQAIYMAMAVAAASLALAPFVLARLWLYYCIRWIENSLQEDAGGNIGDAYYILASKGIPPETACPYDISKFKDDPGPEVDTLAFDSRGKIGINYHPITSVGDGLIYDVECALTSKRAVVFGCTVSEAFCSTIPSGAVEAPKPTDTIAGGHCMTVIGHDHARRRFLVKNSWGDSWQDPDAGPGCFFMVYDYFTDLSYGASDIWIVDSVPAGVGH